MARYVFLWGKTLILASGPGTDLEARQENGSVLIRRPAADAPIPAELAPVSCLNAKSSSDAAPGGLSVNRLASSLKRLAIINPSSADIQACSGHWRGYAVAYWPMQPGIFSRGRRLEAVRSDRWSAHLAYFRLWKP